MINVLLLCARCRHQRAVFICLVRLNKQRDKVMIVFVDLNEALMKIIMMNKCVATGTALVNIV